MSKQVIVFGGTMEGRLITHYLASAGLSVYVCVATAYGKNLLKGISGDVQISDKRLDEKQMEELFADQEPEVIVDATHPFAREVTANIRAACFEGQIPYLRIIREEKKGSLSEDRMVYVNSIGEAVSYLEGTKGNILVTTGSKELRTYTKLTDYQRRIYARVLSLPNVVAACAEKGIQGKHLICMQGPFSMECNVAMLQQVKASYLVTKESGESGGFYEKMLAADQCGVTAVIIKNPEKTHGNADETDGTGAKDEKDGYTFLECRRELAEHFEIPTQQHVTIVGIGMGDRSTMTVGCMKACIKADLIIGAARMVGSIRKMLEEDMPFRAPDYLKEYRAKEIISYLSTHQEYQEIVIVMSGDTGFYSGTNKLIRGLRRLEGQEPTIVAGISSLSYFSAKLGVSWEDVLPVSLHGKKNHLTDYIEEHRKLFAIVGTKDAIGKECRLLTEAGYGKAYIAVGQKMGYPEEEIVEDTAEEFAGSITDALSVLLVDASSVEGNGELWFPKRNVKKEVEEELDLSVGKHKVVTHGIPDTRFIRGQAPMTKEEIRSISLSKLELTDTATLYDVGAGTGSVSIEAALQLSRGMVYAIEKREDAVEILRKNQKKFAVKNLQIISGEAPDGLWNLPTPTHVFVGGSSGNLKEILRQILERNPQVRIVLNAITLETIQEIMTNAKDAGVELIDVVQVFVSKAKKAGNYHMMMGQNPVWIVTLQGKGHTYG